MDPKTRKARVVIMNMLRVRNYKLPENEDDFMQSEEYLTYKNSDENDKIYIFFPKIPKVGVGTIRQYITEMKDNNVSRSIIVFRDTITAFAKQAFKEPDAKSLIIEDFREGDLYVDKLSHVLVPKHELLTDEQKKNLLAAYKIKEINLPKMINSDPIARYFGASRGQVFKITRPSETAGKYIIYRIVI
jgi:DNA-directed RNA polymerase I, II, and III subunit RPABC1